MNLGDHSARNTAAQSGLLDVVSKNTGYPVTSEFQISNKKCPVVYLKFKSNWVPYILSGNPVLKKPLQNSGAENREVDGCPRAQRSAVWDGRLQAGLGGGGPWRGQLASFPHGLSCPGGLATVFL